MNDWYFYQDLGKTAGPINVDEVKERIKDGRIRVFDLLYKDGESTWKIALEHSSLRSEFKAGTLSSLKEKPWICLQRKKPASPDFVTTGPFSQEEVRESLLGGKISHSDYAWKDGFSEWKRIGSLEEFNPRARSSALPHVPPVAQESAAELLKNVVEVKRPAKVKEEVPAWVDPLAKTQTSIMVKAPLPPLPDQAPPPPVMRQPTPVAAQSDMTVPIAVQHTASLRSQLEDTRTSIEVVKPMVDWTVVGALVLLLIGAVLIISRFAIPHTPSVVTEPVPAPEPVVAAPQQPVFAPPAPQPMVEPPSQADLPPPVKVKEQVPEEAELKPTQVTPAVPSRPPKELFLAVQPQGLKSPRIEVRTDGSPDFPVNVQIVGIPGQLTEGGMYYRFLHLKPPGNAQQPLDLSGIKLPEGKFILRAETGTLKKEAKLNFGANDPQLKLNLSRQRKVWAHAVWKDRLNLFHLSQLLEKQITLSMVPGGKRLSLHGLETVAAVKRGAGANYFLFEDWWELHEIMTEAKNGVTPALAVRAQKERDRLASLSVWK